MPVRFASKGMFKMPSKPLTDLQKEYKKAYENYLRRIKSAKAAGIEIPERYIKPKKEKPRARDIEVLKSITRQKLLGNKNASVKSETQKEYNKVYRNYLRRIKSAREAGFVIPEESIVPKAEVATKKEIDRIKQLNREKFKEDVLKDKIGFLSSETGEILTGTHGYEQSRKRRKPEYSTSDLISLNRTADNRYKEWLFSEENVTRPTTFDEYIKIVEEINSYIDKYNPPESSREFLIDRQIEQLMRAMRGPTFNYDTFKETEKEHGWFFQDPNRPLESEEVKLIQDFYDYQHDKTPEGKLFEPTKTIPQLVEELRGWNPSFNYYDKFLDTELEQKENVFNTINEYPEDQFKKYSRRPNDGYYERPKTGERPSSDTAEEPLEYLFINNLIERLNAVEFHGKSFGKDKRAYKISIAQQNRRELLDFIYGEVSHGNAEKLDNALRYQEEHGRAFQVWFLYDGNVFADFMSDLEHLMFSSSTYYEQAEDFETGFENGGDYEE